MLTISHAAWASELSEDYDERSRVMAGVPLLTGLAAAAIMWRFPLDAARQRELRAAISRREH